MERIVLTSAEFPDGRVELLPHQLPAVMGRSRECDITINDGLLSRRHSEIRLNASGRVEVCDLDSTNLTIVNEQDIVTHELQTGDVILLGETQIRVELVNAEDDPNEKTTRDFPMVPGPKDETVEN